MFRNYVQLLSFFLLLLISISCNNIDCTEYKEGSFFTLINSDTIYISRIGNTQTEEYKGYKTFMDVEWISPCSYKLTTISEINRDSFDVDTTFNEYLIKIIATTNSTYIYQTTVPGQDFIDESIMYRDKQKM